MKKFELYLKQFQKTLHRQTGMLSTVAVVVTLMCYLSVHHDYPFLKLNLALPGLLSVSLGLLLVFRNNTAYEKWWEGRKELGNMVNSCRNLALQITTYLLPEHQLDKQYFCEGLILFAHQMKNHLRGENAIFESGFYDHAKLDIIQVSDHRPNVIIKYLHEFVQEKLRSKEINEHQMQGMVNNLSILTDVVGRCERIKATPIPMAYAFLLKMFVMLYVLILPLTLIHDIEWWTLPIVLLIAYVLFSIITTAEEIEDPFGHDLNDLPMDTITNNITKNIREIYHTQI